MKPSFFSVPALTVSRTSMWLWPCFLFVVSGIASADEFRVTAGLQVLYDFTGEGDIVRDRADGGAAVDLKIADLKAVKRFDGGLQVLQPTLVQSVKPPERLMSAIRQSREITAEVWVQPSDAKQQGPARVLTISKDGSNRNFTVGQEFDRFDVRLRTTKTTTNGIPSLSSPKNVAGRDLSHVVYTHAADGVSRIYVDGKQVAEQRIGGDLSNWDGGYRLGLANELSKDRPWLGTLRLMAIYSRALSGTEVSQNFNAGPEGRPSPELIAKRKQAVAARHFETEVAPLLAKHCLECHDTATHENGLDLSTQLTAMKGGENGKAILPGKAIESLLWATVESDSMPLERTPLTTAEKATLKKWIDDGAVFTLNQIDPAVYAHGSSQHSFVQRLTVDEYIETVRATVGVDIEEDARRLLPPDLRADGFSNTAYNLGVDLKHVGAYAQLAELIVQQMDVGAFVSQFAKTRKFTDKDMGEVISRLGHWVLRGPVEDREVIAYRGITTAVASAGGNFDEAMALVIEAMLQSPRFIYRVEYQKGSGASIPANSYELASRLSYIIWGSPPDRELLKAADSGAVNVPEQADRMLKDPRAVQQSLRFAADWLNLKRLSNVNPDRERFPEWNSELARDMRSETLAFFEDVVWRQNKPLSELLNSQVTFVTPQLAKFYGLDWSGQTEKTVLQRIDLTGVKGRGGLLTQGSLLTIGGDNASMVTRGLLVMHELLRGVVKDPPPCVDTTPVPTKPGLTQRGIAMERIANNSCGGCHSRFEPLAFGLEKFDGVGAFHDVDQHGNKLRDDGEILFPGTAASVKYNSSEELMNLLAESDRVKQSMTWKITQFALGRPLVAEDARTVDEIHAAAQRNGGRWSDVIKAVVTSDLVTMTRTEPAAE